MNLPLPESLDEAIDARVREDAQAHEDELRVDMELLGHEDGDPCHLGQRR